MKFYYNWLLTTDIDFANYRTIIEAFDKTLNQIGTIDTEQGFVEPKFNKNRDSLVSRENNFQRNVSKLKTKLNF